MPIEFKGDEALVTCDCGKQLTRVDKYGMFCEDLCGHEESVAAEKIVEEAIQKALNIFK